MAKFFVGQRVRVKFVYEDRFKKFVGAETVITGGPEIAENSRRTWIGYEVALSPLFAPEEFQLEPILDQHEPCDAEFKQSLDDLLNRTERTNIRI